MSVRLRWSWRWFWRGWVVVFLVVGVVLALTLVGWRVDLEAKVGSYVMNYHQRDGRTWLIGSMGRSIHWPLTVRSAGQAWPDDGRVVFCEWRPTSQQVRGWAPRPAGWWDGTWVRVGMQAGDRGRWRLAIGDRALDSDSVDFRPYAGSFGLSRGARPWWRHWHVGYRQGDVGRPPGVEVQWPGAVTVTVVGVLAGLCWWASRVAGRKLDCEGGPG